MFSEIESKGKKGRSASKFSLFRKSQSRQETAVLRWLGFGSSVDLQPKPPTPEQEQMKKVWIDAVMLFYPRLCTFRLSLL